MKLKRIMIAASVLLSVSCYTLPAAATASAPSAAVSAVTSYDSSYNPCNKQDDMEVPYDGSRWVQPVKWNVPTIRPKDYNGGIMLFFDKIGFDAGYANGKVQRVYFSVRGATEPVSLIKFHIFYDTRLTVKENSNGEFVNSGKAVKSFTTGSSMVEEGQLAFYAYSDENILLDNASLFTIDFIIPEDAEQGDVYPIGISYVDDGIVPDMFINSQQDEAGRLQMTYVFTKGIYNGYLKINGEKQTTTTTTSTTTSTKTTTTTAVTTAPPVPNPEYKLGDVNNDGLINAVDASSVLEYYAIVSSARFSTFTAGQKLAADVNHDGFIDAVDASKILSYYAYLSTAKDDIMPLEEYIKT
ncbi:dockerin type I domain-containing protein [Ruminococcus sp.]|uniref:dockerin type I domain-containing protein n=1 Tax=Ruminococcus sp. TaxID=41978 RepID=UPI0025D053CA|nr:dockerin type I domain-containing protein [Ruminococcus sp.]